MLIKTRQFRGVDFVAVDIETTGLDPSRDRIVELAAVRFDVESGLRNRFESLVNPQCLIPNELTRIHGITNQMVSTFPTATQVMPRFLDFLHEEKSILVAHNARFDLAFLEAHWRRTATEPLTAVVVDTVSLARSRLPRLQNYTLNGVSDFFRLSTPILHRALSDATRTMDVFVKLIHESPPLKNCEELFGLARPIKLRIPPAFSSERNQS